MWTLDYHAQLYAAKLVASVAHTACKQFRADGVTPYIEHPRRVSELVSVFSTEMKFSGEERYFMKCAAYLHDVIEDTGLTAEYLRKDVGIHPEVIKIVLLLTKPDPGPAPKSYYYGIMGSDMAMLVKCADRCANLEDALKELFVEEPTTPRRWAKYVEKTYQDVLPMYDNQKWQSMRKQLLVNLNAIEKALPASMEKRAKVVERERSKNNVSDCSK